MKTILLIDDDPDILLITSVTLKKSGKYDVHTVQRAHEAIPYAKEHRPDAIITDFMMDDVDGATLLEFLKADENTSHVPVIFLTAKKQPGTVEQLMSLGAKGVIQKPFDPETLPDQIEEILNS